MACEIKDLTNNPICSDSIKDLKDNAIIMDQYINSEELEVPDRLGVERKTWAGLEEDVRDSLANLDPKVEQLIADKIIAQGGVEIANEWGDSKEKVINQEFLSGENEKIWSSLDSKADLLSVDSDIESINNRMNSIHDIKSTNGDDFYYEVITGINPSQIGYKSFKNPSGGGFVKHKAKRAIAQLRATAVINGGAFANFDGTPGWSNDIVKPNGILIEDGEVLSEWESSSSALRNQACCLMDSGEIKRFNRDSHSAQEMVDEGAVFGFSFGAFCVQNGVVPPDFVESPMGDNDTVSARTVITQYYDGSIGFVLIKGETNKNGATGNQCAELCVLLGVKTAFIVEGGGNTQCYWGNSYTENFGNRPIASYFVLTAPYVRDFECYDIPLDTPSWVDGSLDTLKPPLYYSRIGKSVKVSFNASGYETGIITRLPLGNRPRSGADLRGVFNSGAGHFQLLGGTGDGLGNITLQNFGSSIPSAVSGSIDFFSDPD